MEGIILGGDGRHGRARVIMDELFFRDEKRCPTEAAIAKALNEAAPSWKALWATMREEHPEIDTSWRHYADAKGWLLKASKGTKTICWVAVQTGVFQVGFHFADRLASAVLEANLSPARKKAFQKQPSSGKLRSLRVEFGPASGIRDVMTLVELKLRLK